MVLESWSILPPTTTTGGGGDDQVDIGHQPCQGDETDMPYRETRHTIGLRVVGDQHVEGDVGQRSGDAAAIVGSPTLLHRVSGTRGRLLS